MNRLMKLIGSISLFLVFNVSCFSIEPDSLYKLGLNAIDKHEYKHAITYFNEGLANDLDPKYFVQLAYCHNQRKEFDSQKEVIYQGLKLFPEEPTLYGARGIFHRITKEMDASVRDFGRAMNYSIDDTMVAYYQVERAWSEYYMQDFESAEQDCLEVYEFDSTNLGGLNGLAMIYEATGYPEKAISFLKKMYQVDPTETTILVNIGFTYQNIGNYEESIIYLDSAVFAKPNSAVALSNRSYTRMKLGDLKGALEDVNKSLELYGSNCYAYRNKGLIFLAMGKEGKACKAFEKADDYGFSQKYGPEVSELRMKHCN